MGGLCSCLGRSQADREEEEASINEARSKAAEAAEKRLQAFEKSPGGKAARKAMEAASKPTLPSNRGEPALRWQVG